MEVIVQQLQQYTPPESTYDVQFTTQQPTFTTNPSVPCDTNVFQDPSYQQAFNTYLGHRDELLTPIYNNHDSVFEPDHNDADFSEENTSFSQTKELLPTEPIFEENIIADNNVSSSFVYKVGNGDLPPTEPMLVGEYGSVEFLGKVTKELPSTEAIFEEEENVRTFHNRPLRELLLRESFERRLIPTVNLCSEEKVELPSTEPVFDENALQESPNLRSFITSANQHFPGQDLPPTEPIDDEVYVHRPAALPQLVSKTRELPDTEPCDTLRHSFTGVLNLRNNVELPDTEPVDVDQEQAIDLSVKVPSLKDLQSNLDIDMPKEDDTVLINDKCAVVSLATTIRVSQCQDDDDIQVLAVTKVPHEQSIKEAADMEKLRLQLPKLDAAMKLERKVGEGTFSSVYLATLRNNPSAKFAVKHLTPTCLPSRIKRELQCLRDIGGVDNVSGIHLCLRNQGCVVFVMPYQPHTRFTDYVLDMDAAEAKLYMRNLLIALRRVHSFGIIHRDVKPGNFLYDRENKNFLLVDFGLAQSVTSVGQPNKTVVQQNKPAVQPNKPTVQQTKPVVQPNKPTVQQNKPAVQQNKSVGQPNKSSVQQNKPAVQQIKPAMQQNKPVKQNRFSVELPRMYQPVSVSRNAELLAVARSMKRKREEDISENVKKVNLLNIERLSKRPALQTQIDNTRNIILPPKPPSKPMGPQFQLLAPPTATSNTRNMSSFVRVQNSRVKMVAAPLQSKLPARRRCACFGKAQICELCLVRPKLVAPRAGTPGFRPPEVLLKSMNQTTAVDMWAAGVLLLSILSGCYPFFRSPDDMTALAEVMTLLGSRAIKDTAQKLDRMFSCDRERAPLDLQKLCVRLRTNRISRVKSKQKGESNCELCCSVCGPSLSSATGKVPCLCRSAPVHTLTTHFPAEAYDLLYRLLDPNPDSRITAVQALDHPFLKE